MRSLILVAYLLTAAAPATAAPLAQPSGAAGCAEHSGAERCSRVKALRGESDVALSPDGRFAYVAARDSGAVVTLRRSPGGRLRPLPEGRVRTPGGIARIRVTPDGRHAYATGLAAFRRDRQSGRLTRIPAPRTKAVHDLVVAPDGRHLYLSRPLRAFARDARTGRLRAVRCTACAGVPDASALAISPDGASLYVASRGDTVVTLRRDRRSGRLRPLPADRRCVSAAPARAGCRAARAIRGIDALVVTPDGADVYVSASRSDTSGEPFTVSSGIALLRRDAADGALTQPDGPAGCFAYSGEEEQGCTRTGGQLFGPGELALSPDGRSMLAVHGGLDAVRLLRRDPATSALTEDGCLSRAGRFGCARGRGLESVASIAGARDGRGFVTAGGAVSSLLVTP